MTAQSQDPNQTAPNIDITSPYTMRRPAPILSISMNHPIGKAARKIKNFMVHKQTLFSTTFTIKITPIVAIVSLFGVATLFGGGITTAFQFGKTVEEKFLADSQPKPTKTPKNTAKQTPVTIPLLVNVSKAGIIKMTYQLPARLASQEQKYLLSTTIVPALNSPGMIVGSESALPSTPPVIPTLIPSPTPIIAHYILTRGESIIFLLAPPNVHLRDYIGMKVLVTGNFDANKNTLAIEKPEDIEILQ